MSVRVLLLVLVVGFGCSESSSTGVSDCESTNSCSALGDALLPMTEPADAGNVRDDFEVSASDATPENVDADSAAVGGNDDLGTGETVMETAFVQVNAGGYHSCARRGTGEVVCWGRNNHGQLDVPDAVYVDVSSNYWHSCGVTDANEIRCWGDDEFGQSNASDGQFVAVAAGYWHSCGLLSDGEVECWGLEDGGRTTPPAGPFVSIDAGWYHTCAVRMDQSVVCWGMNTDEQSDPVPELSFEMVKAGGLHTCGVVRMSDETDEVQCWGSTEYDQGTPTVLGGEQVVDLSSGAEHTCAVYGGGVAECWGQNSRGQSSVPDELFLQVSAGLDHSCGLTTERTVLCWGRNNHGQLDPTTPR